jgi:predicted SnoaL-like aldol condensation-catalyzing enzyme
MQCPKNFVAFFQELKEIIKIINAKITALIAEMNEVVQLTFHNVVTNPSLVHAR